MQHNVIDALRKMVGHPAVKLTEGGNSAIFIALYLVKKLRKGKLLIPDQGGWLTYKAYADMLGIETAQYSTDAGLVVPSKLQLDNVSAVIVNDPAGYFAGQDIEAVYHRCSGNALIILDITGSISTKQHGAYADFCVCSFGKWKPVNLGYGGMVSSRLHGVFQQHMEIFSLFNVAHMEDRLAKKLDDLPARMKFFHDACNKIKKDLNSHDILHSDKEGINVVIGFSDEAEKQGLIGYCNANHYEYTVCPREIRVNKDAISIEVKRL